VQYSQSQLNSTDVVLVGQSGVRKTLLVVTSLCEFFLSGDAPAMAPQAMMGDSTQTRNSGAPGVERGTGARCRQCSMDGRWRPVGIAVGRAGERSGPQATLERLTCRWAC